MDAGEAGLIFPVLGFTPNRRHAFAVDSLELLNRPKDTLLGEDGLAGAELVDSSGARFRINTVDFLPRGRSWRASDVALDLESLGRTTLEAVKADLVTLLLRDCDNSTEHQDLLEELAVIQTADSLAQLMSRRGGHDFVGYKRRDWYEPHMGRAPDPPFDDKAIGPAVDWAKAELAWPLIGIPSPPRSLMTLRAFAGPEDFTRAYASDLKPGMLPRMELIDSWWRRYRIVEVRRLGRDGLPFLWVFATLYRVVRVKVDYAIEPLPPTSLEETRARFLAMFDHCPAGWTWDWDEAAQKRERARLAQADSVQALAAGFFHALP